MDHVPRGRLLSAQSTSYARGARVLSVGIATTGVVTFAYFSVASYALSEVEYKNVALLWAVMFVIVSVIYRPIEQLLSRTIAERRARGLHHGHPLGIPLLIQATFALLFLIIALAVREPVQDDVFDGSAALYWILVGGVLAYAASYFARGWLAGHQRFALYGGLVLLESCSRFLFAVAAVVGLTHGEAAVALGMAAAPCVSLFVVPLAWSRKDPSVDLEAVEQAEGGLTLRHGAGFAVSVLAVMLAEQTLVNGAVLSVDATATDAALAGVVFSVLLIARAPLQLFQAIQGTLLPHLATLQATAGRAEFRKAIRTTLLAIAAFALHGGARALHHRPLRAGRAVRRRLRLRTRWPCDPRARRRLPPRGGDAEPGGPRARADGARGDGVARRRRALPGLDVHADHRRRARAGRGGLLRRGGAAGDRPGAALPPRGRACARAPRAAPRGGVARLRR